MQAKFRSGWQKIGQHRVAIIITTAVIALVIVLITIGYNFDWTGFNTYSVTWLPTARKGTSLPITKLEEQQPAKTLWDWLQLLIIPIVLAIGGFLFTQIQKGIEQRITDDNQQEVALQAYIDSMSDLLLKEGLRKSDSDAEVRKIARVRTLTILSRVNTVRKKRVLQFLFESGLIYGDRLDVLKSGLIIPNKKIIDLLGADLSGVYLDYSIFPRINLSLTNLRGASLIQANLNEANLSGAILIKALLIGTQLNAANLQLIHLEEAILVGANLAKANLSRANLEKADLSYSDLREASLTRADFTEANLSSANLQQADLSEANFTKANLRYAHFEEANLTRSNLQGANLVGAYLQGTTKLGPKLFETYQVPGADLSEADLSNANLREAQVSQEQLKQAKSLQGATMPDGSIHP